MQLTQANTPPPFLAGQRVAPLQIRGDLNVSRDRIYANCRAAMQSGYPSLQDRSPEREQPLCIVGSSPDVEKHFSDICKKVEAGAHVMAVKGAHDWLIERGITPTYAVAADAQPERAKIFRNRKQGVVYLLASQMDQDTWDWMRGYSVLLWHPLLDNGVRQRELPEWKGVRRVYGGVTTGLRAISLGWILGYMRQTLFGFSSSVRRGGLMRFDGKKTESDDPPFPVNYCGRWFLTNTCLAQQVADLMPTLQQCPGIRMDAVGDGPLPWVLENGKRMGWPV